MGVRIPASNRVKVGTVNGVAAGLRDCGPLNNGQTMLYHLAGVTDRLIAKAIFIPEEADD
jgi:hypothetical protein